LLLPAQAGQGTVLPPEGFQQLFSALGAFGCPRQVRVMQQWRAAAHGGEQKAALRRGERQVAKAATRSNLQAAADLTTVVDGRLQFVPRPPVVERLVDVLPGADRQRLAGTLTDLVASYSRSLPADRQVLLAQFRVVDIARKVVGVGSVGTRCWIVLLLGRDSDDPLILQAKEAQASVLESFLPASRYAQVADGRVPVQTGV
jgi:uncharacterized protein (DUF2252 family)